MRHFLLSISFLLILLIVTSCRKDDIKTHTYVGMFSHHKGYNSSPPEIYDTSYAGVVTLTIIGDNACTENGTCFKLSELDKKGYYYNSYDNFGSYTVDYLYYHRGSSSPGASIYTTFSGNLVD